MHVSRSLLLIPLIAIAVLCAACGPATTPDKLIVADDYRNKTELASAIIHTKNLVQADPTNPANYQNLGDLYLTFGKPDQALGAYEEARELGVESPELAMAEMKAKVRAGFHDEVIDEITRHKNPSPELTGILAEAYYTADNFDSARPLYEEMTDTDRYMKLGRMERKSGRYETSLQFYQQAFAEASDASALLWVGRMQRFFDPQSSIAHFHQLAGIGEFERYGNLELARTYLLVGDPATSATYLNKLIDKYPGWRKTLFLSGVYEYQQGNLESAFTTLLIPYFRSRKPDFLLPLALVEYELESFTAARAYAQRLLFDDPLNESAAKITFLTQDTFNNPLKPAMKRLMYMAHDPQLLRMIGEFSLRKGETDFALQAFTRARRALEEPEDTHVSFSIDLGISPERTRIFLPARAELTDDTYGDNCFGLAATLDISKTPSDNGPCRKEILTFLLGLRALNNSDTGTATKLFKAALDIDADLTQAKVLLAQMNDPRYSSTGFRLASPLDSDRQDFGERRFQFDVSDEQWQSIREAYAGLAGAGSYEFVVVEAESMLRRGKTTAAYALLNRLTKTHPSRFGAYRVLAEHNMKNSSGYRWLRQTRKQMSDALWDSWEMRLLRARIHEGLGNEMKASRAARALQDPIDLYPSFPTENRLELAELQLRLGQTRVAADNFSLITDDALAPEEIKRIARQRVSEIGSSATRRVAAN